MIASVVAIQPIFFAVDFQNAFIDTVAESADERAEIAAVVQIAIQRIVSEQDVAFFPVFIGKNDALQYAAVR